MIMIIADLSGKELVVAASILASGLIRAFGIVRVITNLSFILKEMDEQTATTN